MTLFVTDTNGCVGADKAHFKFEGLDLDNFALFVSQWLRNDCKDLAGDDSDWCFNSDLSRDAAVNYIDYAKYARYGLI